MSAWPSVARRYCAETTKRIKFTFGIDEATLDLGYIVLEGNSGTMYPQNNATSPDSFQSY